MVNPRRSSIATFLSVAFVTARVLFLAGCAGGESVSSGTELELPPGVVLKHWVSGSIAGLADELTITSGFVGELRVYDRLLVGTPLTDEETEELRDLIARLRSIATSHQDPPDVADGMGSGLLFAGRGKVEGVEEVQRFAGELMQKLKSVAEISRKPVVVVGEARERTHGKGRELFVSEVLRADLSEGDITSGDSVEFEHGGPREGATGARIWGLWLQGEDGRRRGAIASWHHAPLKLKSRVLAAIADSN